jgi:hypothetical protein
MKEPGMGDSVYWVRHALYEWRYREQKEHGATMVELLNYMHDRRMRRPIRNLNVALERLIKYGLASPSDANWKASATRFSLTPDGQLSEEENHKTWRRRVLDQVASPVTVANLIIGGLGAVVGGLIALALRH